MTNTKQLNVRLPTPFLDKVESRRLEHKPRVSKQVWIEFLLELGLTRSVRNGR